VKTVIAQAVLFFLKSIKVKICLTPYCNVKENEDIVKEKSKVSIVKNYITTAIAG